MSVQTLEELREENSHAETNETPGVEVVEELSEPEVETEETTETKAEENEPLEFWQQSDDSEPTNDDGQFVPVKKHASVRKKLKGELKEANGEIESLKAEIEQLKSGTIANTQPAQSVQTTVPKLEDFDYDETQYSTAMQKWIQNQVNQTQQAQVQQQTQQQYAKQVQNQVNDHYQRASELIENAGISEDTYRAADNNVRVTFDSVFPGQGDTIVDNLITKLGEGSEKVLYRVGVNANDRSTLHRLLQEDSSGLSAAAYLGELKAKVSSAATQKKISKAPKPSMQLDGKAVGGSSESALREKYRKTKEPQKRYQLARDGKKQGFNTHNW